MKSKHTPDRFFFFSVLSRPTRMLLVLIFLNTIPPLVSVSHSNEFVLDSNDLLQLPGDPVLSGSLEFASSAPISVYVSGRYAYLVDADLNDFKVIDVSDPGLPSVVGNLAIGPTPFSVYVSGRYAYVVDQGSDDLKVIDVSNPSDPNVVGILGIGSQPRFVVVSGRYAYVVDSGSGDLKVIDVSDPSAPSQVSSLIVGASPRSLYVSGRYAYVTDHGSDDLKVIDVSDPGAPSLVSSLIVGGAPNSVYVSGRYAYVVDVESDDLKVIDVSDPSVPSVTGSLPIGTSPRSVYVSGSYAYVVDAGVEDLRMIDVSDPGAPSEVGTLIIGGDARSVQVSGRYAYVVDALSNDIKVIDISGAEVTSMVAHSLEAGNLQVRNDIIVQGQLQVTGGLNVGTGGAFSDGNVGLSGTLAIANDIVPNSSPANLVQLYAEDVAGSSELKIRDEAGQITTISPHNFSLVGKPSESMAWSFYSENDRGKINVDMLRMVRLIEAISGQKLVFMESKGSNSLETVEATLPGLTIPLLEVVKTLKAENEALENQLKALNDAMERRLEALEKKLSFRQVDKQEATESPIASK